MHRTDANGNRIKLRFATLLARKPTLIRRGVGKLSMARAAFPRQSGGREQETRCGENEPGKPRDTPLSDYLLTCSGNQYL
ncbi:hypothetical protein MJ561_16275 [Klebsiella pneumoniae]|nr:hypothetical protein MJ561_16275 [Klebsiella pneumoniae]